MKPARAPWLALVFIELLCFAPFSGRVGFYHDDWTNLERCYSSGGLWRSVKAYALIVPDRPLEILHYPLLYAWGGFHPLRYQLVFLALEALTACLLYRLLVRLLRSGPLALAAASLFTAFPTHAITHHWLGSSAQTAALLLLFASFLKHCDWLEGLGRGALAWSLGLYAAALLEYEAVAFLPLMLAGGLWGRAGGGRKALMDAARAVAPYALPLAAVLLWQRWGVGLLTDAAAQRGLAFSWSHAARAYLEGLGGLTWQLAALCLESASELAAGSRALFLLGLTTVPLLLALSAVPAYDAARKPSADEERAAFAGAAGAAAGAFLAAFLPYALSADYTPSIRGIMARTSVMGALAGALALGLWTARSEHGAFHKWRWLAWLGTLSLFVMADWRQTQLWARSWEAQKEILALAGPAAARLPRGATLLVAGFPRFVGEEGTGALVFDAPWDIGPALRITAGRPDLSANVVSDRLRFRRDGVVESFGGRVLRRYGYDNLFLYGTDRKALFRVLPGDGPPRLEPF